MNETRGSIYRLGASGEPDKEAKFWDQYHQFTVCYNKAKKARTLCFMAGLDDIAKNINSYCDLIWEVQSYFGRERFSYDVEIVNANTDSMTALRNDVLDQLGPAFESIYK